MFQPTWRKFTKSKKAHTRLSGVRLGIEQLEDRTLPSVTLVAQVNQQMLGSYPTPVLASGGKVFFQADNGVDGSQLWATPGSGATELTALLNGGTYGHTAANGRDVFVGYSYDAANNYHEVLHGSDGSA